MKRRTDRSNVHQKEHSKRQRTDAHESSKLWVQDSDPNDSAGKDFDPFDEETKSAVSSPAGILCQIDAENFMNHEKLSISFGRDLNLIHGQTGSGISAIIAALKVSFLVPR